MFFLSLYICQLQLVSSYDTECFLDLAERWWKRHLKFTNNKEINQINHSTEEVKSLTLSQSVRIFREKCCLNSELYQDIVVFYQSFSVLQKNGRASALVS